MAERILVTGASSQIGEFLLPRMSAEGMEIVGMSRLSRQSCHGVTWVRGDLRSKLDLPLAVEGIISLSPLWLLPEMLRNMARGGRLRRVVAMSSTSAETKKLSASATERQLAVRLLAAESAVTELALEYGISLTILRPALIYGAGRDRNICTLARIIRSWRFFPLVDGGRGLRQPIHAEDLAIACTGVWNCALATGRRYDVAGGETLSYREMVGRLFDVMALRRRFVNIPVAPVSAASVIARIVGAKGLEAAAQAAGRMTDDLCFSNDAAVSDFGFRPRAFLPQWPELGLPR